MFKCKVVKYLIEIKERLEKMSQVIDDFKTSVEAAFTAIGTSLTTIAADEAALVTGIQALQAQINGSLSSTDQASLAQVVADAQALVNRTAATTAAMPTIATVTAPPVVSGPVSPAPATPAAP